MCFALILIHLLVLWKTMMKFLGLVVTASDPSIRRETQLPKPIPILIIYHADTFNPIQARPRRSLVKTCFLHENANLNVFSRKYTKRVKH